jgi:hypothetical protein
MTITRRARAAAAAALLTAAVAAPTAAAAGDENGGIELRRDGSKAVEVVTVRETAPRVDGFDWRDAGLGAAGGVAALLLASAGARVVRGGHSGQRSPLAAHRS